ncbi:unnamed protein product [Symbiodinium sp. CCMP2456]|nr:unnamed protein product [Symbiodinium sp. CCMP2456]
MALPIDVYLFGKGILFAPMCLPSKILEFYLCRKPSILFGGFDRNHFALGGFLQSFWECYRYEDGDHQVFQVHGDRLNRCFPFCIYADEGRGLRKAPIQVVALETLWGLNTFAACEKLAETRGWNTQTFLEASDHTGRGSSLTSRLLLYVLPHGAYKKKQKQFWYDTFNAPVKDLTALFTSGITDQNGETWFPILIGVKGDAPALNKIGNFNRSFLRIIGQKGICHLCLAGKPGHAWEDMGDSASWHGTFYQERPWTDRKPSCVLPIPFSLQAPEKVFRSDCMHLVKLGVARHFIASCVVALGDWDIFPGSAASMANLLELSHNDFVWCWKAADSLMLARWLLRLLRQGPVKPDETGRSGVTFLSDPEKGHIFRAMEDACCSLLRFFQIIHKNGLWLNRSLGQSAAVSVELFCLSYTFLA